MGYGLRSRLRLAERWLRCDRIGGRTQHDYYDHLQNA
ncbi:hypothetical protein sync_0191 [Synechococcus sp. CC9311]|nr:hypothetical protein sync_0191 [Synechococcus sp. CC9311]